MPRIYKITFFLSTLGAMLSLISLTSWGQVQDSFAWLFFYMPVLWLLWICCVFFMMEKFSRHQLLLLWLIIDTAILLLFISFSMRVEHWANSNGIDMVLLATYFPVIIPTGLIFGLLPGVIQHDISHGFDSLLALLGGGIGDAFAVWMCLSMIAAFQSMVFVGVSRFLIRWKHT